MNRQQLLLQMVCLGLVALLLVGCGGAQVEPTAMPTPIPSTPTATVTPVPPTPTSIPLTPVPMTRLDGKRALFVIYERFEDNEYGIPRAILEDLGVAVTVAALSSDVMKGYEGTEVQPDVLLGDVRGGDYDAIVFVGGAEYKLDDPEGQRIAQEAVAEGKVVAAICIAPITLARAGVVEGKRVTAAALPKELERAGATFTGASVERDGLIITANSPGGARKFGEAIAAALGE
jgi:protease I